MRHSPVLLIALWLSPILAGRLTAQGAGASPPKACASPEHHQFDFWIGEWEVSLPNGARAGANLIQPILDGCVVHESWTGAKGGKGQSFNAYDATRRVWHQTWVSDQGDLLILEGRFDQGKMILVGEKRDSGGAKRLERITWQETAPGEVRQLWDSSTDGGTSWTVQFDGRYRKKAS